MKWRGRRQSRNIDDRRNTRISGLRSGGNSGLLKLLPMVLRLLGIKGTIVVVIGLAIFGLLSGNLQNMLSVLTGQTIMESTPSSQPLQQSETEKQRVEFISVVLADLEHTWTNLFTEQGQTYIEPTLVLFRGAVQSACGLGQSAMGPFYCPADQQVYIDLNFYDQLSEQYNAPGDFAQAYVIAHEVGHHIQTLDGTSQRVYQQKSTLNTTEANKLSVLQELQADCLAGVWAYHANNSRQLLEQGDIEEGLTAASAIGDDTLQKQARGYVSPDSFTHGSSAQRVKWFKTGYETGNRSSCNTFK
jgi:predicted metalloprotease